MDRFILTAVIPVKAKTGDDVNTEIPLTLLIIRDVHKRIINRRFGGDFLKQCNLLGAQRVKDVLDVNGLHACFEVVEQHVVNMVIRLEERHILAAHFHQFFKARPENFEIIFLARVFPGHLGNSGFASKLGYPFNGYFGVLLVFSRYKFD